MTRSGKWQLAEYMGKYHIRSCANIESSTCFGLLTHHFRFFFFSSCFLEFPLTCVGLFFHLYFCVCTHVQPLTVGVVPIHTEADFFLWVYWKLDILMFFIFSIAAQYQDRFLCFTHHYFSGIGPKHKCKEKNKRTNWKLINFPELLQKLAVYSMALCPVYQSEFDFERTRFFLIMKKNTKHDSKLLLFNKLGEFGAMTHTMWIFLLS